LISTKKYPCLIYLSKTEEKGCDNQKEISNFVKTRKLSISYDFLAKGRRRGEFN
jgi:hypothetical protein